MKIADILQKLADLAVAIEGDEPGRPDPAIQNPAKLTVVATGAELTDAGVNKPSPNGETASGNAKEPEDVFLPPLQQKQELLKKAVGVDNIYDDGTASDQAEDQQDVSDDIVNRIKKLSGIPVAAVQELSNDDIVDD
jgi:hypothetical protein